jgi:hypothetical protein
VPGVAIANFTWDWIYEEHPADGRGRGWCRRFGPRTKRPLSPSSCLLPAALTCLPGVRPSTWSRGGRPATGRKRAPISQSIRTSRPRCCRSAATVCPSSTWLRSIASPTGPS